MIQISSFNLIEDNKEIISTFFYLLVSFSVSRIHCIHICSISFPRRVKRKRINRSDKWYELSRFRFYVTNVSAQLKRAFWISDSISSIRFNAIKWAKKWLIHYKLALLGWKTTRKWISCFSLFFSSKMLHSGGMSWASSCLPLLLIHYVSMRDISAGWI